MRRSILAVVLLGFAALPCRAWWDRPTTLPVERLARNLGRALESHPDDVATLFTLGRIHAYALAYETDHVAWHENPLAKAIGGASSEDTDGLMGSLASASQQRSIFFHRDAPPSYPPTPEVERLAHLEQAVGILQRARELAPERAEIHLSLACVLEAGAPLASKVDSAAFGWPAEKDEGGSPRLDGRVSARGWLARAAASYRRAFELARAEDVALETQPIENPFDGASALETLVSYEAGLACLRLARQGAVAFESSFLAEAETQQKELESKPRSSWITPMLLTLDGCRSLAELATPQRVALFDLDGDGLDEPWPWPAPEAGWLVWDPDGTGAITSGRQLFGSRSGWFFFADGYRAIDALDDDRDGELRGAELAGIAVWFDRDTDGVSDPDEVVPVEELGIVALRTDATLHIGSSPANLCGVEMSDGRVLPTYDWVLGPVRP